MLNKILQIIKIISKHLINNLNNYIIGIDLNLIKFFKLNINFFYYF